LCQSCRKPLGHSCCLGNACFTPAGTSKTPVETIARAARAAAPDLRLFVALDALPPGPKLFPRKQFRLAPQWHGGPEQLTAAVVLGNGGKAGSTVTQSSRQSCSSRNSPTTRRSFAVVFTATEATQLMTRAACWPRQQCVFLALDVAPVTQGTRDVLACAGARQHQFIRPYCRPIADVTLDRLLTPALRCQQW
jgi:hypothetical protein